MPDLTILDLILRVGAACGAGLLMGLDRQLRNKPVGFGTYILVSVGAAMIVAATDLYLSATGVLIPAVNGLVAGLGFLGAGALIKEGASVSGFTTAAAIWLAGTMGLALGLGFYVLGGIGLVVALLVFQLDPLLERYGIGAHSRILHLELTSVTRPSALKHRFRDFRAKTISYRQQVGQVHCELRISVPTGRMDALTERCQGLKGIVSYRIE